MQFWVEVTFVSLAFVSSFSPVGIVLKVGERARSSQTDSLWLTATTANKDQEQQETQLSFAAGLGISESGRQR